MLKYVIHIEQKLSRSSILSEAMTRELGDRHMRSIKMGQKRALEKVLII